MHGGRGATEALAHFMRAEFYDGNGREARAILRYRSALLFGLLRGRVGVGTRVAREWLLER